MARSQSLNLIEYRRIANLVGECCEMAGSVVGWRQHFFSAFERLVDADVVLGGDMAGIHSRQFNGLGISDWGWHRGFPRAGWERALAEFAVNRTYLPPMVKYMMEYRPGTELCLSRSQLHEDASWYRLPAFLDNLGSSGLDHHTYCFAPIPNTADVHNGLFVYRATGRPDFNDRERAIILFAHISTAQLIGRPLARFGADRWDGLTLRQREVAECLLEGDSDKQIGKRLGITRNTVNTHLKVLFRRYNVCSRGEFAAVVHRQSCGVGLSVS